MRILKTTLFLLMISTHSFAQEIIVAGSWTATIDASDLVAGAGSDLNSTAISENTAIRINVAGVTGHAWSVSVHCSKSNWPIGLALKAQRTANGSPTDDGDNFIEGGLRVIEITDTPQQFFSGYGSRQYIYAKVGVAGLSVASPPGTATATVYYTITFTD